MATSLKTALSKGEKAIDTDYGVTPCVVLTETPGGAVVVYDDEPDCVVSTGNRPGRFVRTHQSEFRDVDVIPRNALDTAHQIMHPKPWLVQFADGEILHFNTEDEACAAQRNWRRCHGRDPMTGEALR